MRSRGFSLVEILVVLVILGLTVTFATLGFQRLEDDRLQKQAGLICTWLQSVSDNAVLDSAIYGVWLGEESDRLETAYFAANRWWPMTGEEAYSAPLDESIALFLEADNGWRPWQPVTENNETKQPAILFMPTGTAVPGKLQLRDANQRTATVERDENGLYTWSTL